MAAGGSSKISNSTLPVILIAAAVQGWALYALHLSIKGPHWPATEPEWLLGGGAVYRAVLAAAVSVAGTLQDARDTIFHRAA